MAQNYDNSDPVVLEGVYKSIASSVSQVRQSVNDVQETVSKELQYNSAQQMSAYEALVDSFEQGVESLLAELRYVAQQNSTIYEYNQLGFDKLKQDLIDAVKTGTQAIEQKNDEKIAEMGKELERRQDERVQRLRAEILAAIRGMGPRVEGENAEATTEILDGYAVHDDIEEVRVLAQETRDLLNTVHEELNAKNAPKAEGENAEGETESEFDYDVLAEKIVSVLPEVDYDMVADKVAASIGQLDENAVADKVAANIGQLDENAIADKVAEAVPLIDYDLIAERVAAALNGDNGEEAEEKKAEDDGVPAEEKIASAVEEKLDYERIAVRVAELLKEDLKDITITAPVVVAAPAPAPAPVEEHVEELAAAQEIEVAEEPVPVVVAAPAPKKKPTPVVVAEPEEEEQTVRYKYSFTAKIVTSDADVKEYYSAMKNEFLSYPSTSSQINWANDRFSYENETIAKVGVRGKTLCLYLALDPYELPESVYHQSFAGDTKMYEKTPTMVKIKSNVALKRALRLIGLLMEKNGAVQEEQRNVDYAAQFPYRSEEELLQEGLVKAVLVGKSESDFVRK